METALKSIRYFYYNVKASVAILKAYKTPYVMLCVKNKLADISNAVRNIVSYIRQMDGLELLLKGCFVLICIGVVCINVDAHMSERTVVITVNENKLIENSHNKDIFNKCNKKLDIYEQKIEEEYKILQEYHDKYGHSTYEEIADVHERRRVKFFEVRDARHEVINLLESDLTYLQRQDLANRLTELDLLEDKHWKETDYWDG